MVQRRTCAGELGGRIMRFSTPLSPPGFEDELFTTAQTPPPPTARPPFEERVDSMFHYLETQYAGEDAVSNEPNVELGRNGLEFFSPDSAEDGRVHPVTSSRRGDPGEYIASMGFSHDHELGIDLQGKQELSDDDTLSLFPELKMDGVDANTSSTMDGMEDYMSSFALDNLKESPASGVPMLRHDEHAMNSDFARISMLCGNNLLSALPVPRPTFHGQEHRMMVGECEKRTVELEEIFNIQQLLPNVRTSQQPQLEGARGNAVRFISASTPTSERHFLPSAFVPFLPPDLKHTQDVESFSPDLTLVHSEEVNLSPHPIRKLETIGGKKILPCSHYGKGRENYKIKDLCKSSLEYTPSSRASPAFPKTMSSRNFREYLGPASPATCSLGRHAYVQNLVPDLQARSGSTTYCSNTDYLLEGVELSYAYTPQHLQNKPTSGFFGPMNMQIMGNDHKLHELSLFDPVNTGSSTTRDQSMPLGNTPCTFSSTDEQDSALHGFGDVLMASFSKATESQSVRPGSSIYKEDRMLAPSTAFEFLGKDALLSSSIGEGIHVPVTAKRSALTIHTMNPGCTAPQDSSKLTNVHKEKRWIYKQARLPKNTDRFSQVTLKQKKRASRRSEGPATSRRSEGRKKDASRGQHMCPVCICGPQGAPGCNCSHQSPVS